METFVIAMFAVFSLAIILNLFKLSSDSFRRKIPTRNDLVISAVINMSLALWAGVLLF